MIAILKYNAGNIRSVENALNRIGYQCVITDQPETLLNANKVIIPGVGEASTAMTYLKKKNLDDLIISLKQPVLGICLGLQIMCRHSEEGDTAGLGVFDTDVKKFPDEDIVPHMGWNNIEEQKGILFSNIEDGEDFYFVHSYYAELSEQTVAKTNYIKPFSSALQRDNFYAVQFHPEKSQQAGEILLKNFIEL